MKKNKLLCLIAILQITACSFPKNTLQEKETLSNVTQTGANTLSCLFENTLFIPSKSKALGFGTNLGKPLPAIGIGQFHKNTEHSSFSIRAKGYSPNLVTLRLFIYQLPTLGVGSYTLNEGGEDYISKHSYIYLLGKSPNTGKWTKYYSYKDSGNISITRKDDDNNIFSGTFSGKLTNEEETETVEVTQGRFDINISKITLQ